jgi:sodium transport system permease protein
MAVFRKEILDTLRDGRSVFAIFVFPFLLYPAMITLVSWVESQSNAEAEALALRVGIVGASQLPEAREWIAAVSGVTPVTLDAVPEPLEGAGVDAVLVIPGGLRAAIARGDSVRVELLYKESENRSGAAARRLRPVLEEVRNALVVTWARALGARAGGPPAFTVAARDVSSEHERGRFLAALLIPYLLIIMVAAGSMHSAVDATTGEKERSTLETLLATSASRTELVMGKCLAVMAASLTGAITSITGLWLAFNVAARLIPGAESDSMQMTVGPDKALWLFLTLLPAAVFLSATLVAIGCFARSMREGQTYATYVYMAAIFIGILSIGQQTPPLHQFFVPVLNTALLQREILTETVSTLHVVTAVGASSLVAAIMLVIAVRLFSNEGVLFRT